MLHALMLTHYVCVCARVCVASLNVWCLMTAKRWARSVERFVTIKSIYVFLCKRLGGVPSHPRNEVWNMHLNVFGNYQQEAENLIKM